MSDTYTPEQLIQGASRILMRAALNLIESDPHQWSTRPCATCRSVSAILGEPFGCDHFAIKHRAK